MFATVLSVINMYSTSHTPLVSVIIPFLNPGHWLAEAVESVIGQTYTNWEIVLIDDGSVKADTEAAITYSKKFPDKIRYVEHEGHVNKGQAISRNAGIARAGGELVGFLDADDRWQRGKLKRQLDIFQEFPQVQMISEASWFWYDWNDAGAENVIQQVGAAPGIYRPPQLMELLYPLGEGQPPCPSGIIIRREALQRCGGFEEGFSGVYQLYEDQAFLSKVYAREVVYISGEANNLYRKRNDSMSSAANDEEVYKKVRLFYLEWLEEYFLRSASPDARIEKLISSFRARLGAL